MYVCMYHIHALISGCFVSGICWVEYMYVHVYIYGLTTSVCAFLLCMYVQFSGDPVSLAISEAVLTIVEEEGLAAHAQELGSYLMTQLRDLAKKHPCIGDVRYIHCIDQPSMYNIQKKRKCCVLYHDISAVGVVYQLLISTMFIKIYPLPHLPYTCACTEGMDYSLVLN